MNSDIAKELNEFAQVIANRYSMTDREGNYNNESFKVEEIVPTSDHTAIINFRKSSGKLGIAFCYYIARGKSKGWRYFFPTDSHINGFSAFLFYKLEVERERESMLFKIATPSREILIFMFLENLMAVIWLPPIVS